MNKIVISHPLYRDGMALLEGKAEIVITNDGDSDRILDSLIDADAYILRIGKIDRKAIERCEKLKVITRPGVGYDSVDVQAATERGIPVVLCPAANARAVAEHTVALLLACAKNIVESVNETKAGNFGIGRVSGPRRRGERLYFRIQHPQRCYRAGIEPSQAELFYEEPGWLLPNGAVDRDCG